MQVCYNCCTSCFYLDSIRTVFYSNRYFQSFCSLDLWRQFKFRHTHTSDDSEKSFIIDINHWYQSIKCRYNQFWNNVLFVFDWLRYYTKGISTGGGDEETAFFPGISEALNSISNSKILHHITPDGYYTKRQQYWIVGQFKPIMYFSTTIICLTKFDWWCV